MADKKLFTDRRWHDPPAVISLGYRGSSKNEALDFAKVMLKTGHTTETRYQEILAEIEEKYKGHDPDELI